MESTETQSLTSDNATDVVEDVSISSRSPSPGPEEGLTGHQQASMDLNSHEPSNTRSSSPTLYPSPSGQASAAKSIGCRIQNQLLRCKAFFASTWAWELCGICISFTCMIAIIATLPNFNGHPLADWNFVLSPNTLISTFITVSKTSMLLVVAEGISQLKWSYFSTGPHSLAELQHFDAASRGPWGSLTFLLGTKKQAITASLGAFITIAALAMDPFGQQIVSFETRQVAREDSRVTIPVAHDYLFDLDGLGYPNWDMFGALFSCVFDSGYSVPTICPSERCKWPTFSTLGVCSECTNVTESTSLSGCEMEFANYNQSVVVLDPTQGPKQKNGSCVIDMTQKGGKISNCTSWPSYAYHDDSVVWVHQNYSTGYDTSVNISAMYFLHPHGSSTSNTKMEITDYLKPSSVVHRSEILEGKTKVPTWVQDDGFQFTFLNISNLIFTIAEIDLTPRDELQLGTCPEKLTKVTKCQVKWCLKVFEGLEMVNGTIMPYNVRKVATWLDGNETRLREQLPIISLYPTNESSKPLPPGPAVLRVGESAFDSINGIITLLFPTSERLMYSIPYDGFKFDIRSALELNQTATEIMDRVAEGITSGIRMGPNTANVYGTAYFAEVYVAIRWQWLLLPGILILLSALFLLLTMRMSRKGRGPPLWKSRVLPFLFHGLEGLEESDLRVSDEAGMDQAGKMITAQLLKNEEGDRKFVRV